MVGCGREDEDDEPTLEQPQTSGAQSTAPVRPDGPGSRLSRKGRAAAGDATPSELGQCQKCKQVPAELTIRQNEPYCRACLEAGVLHKVRVAVKGPGLVAHGDRVLVALSGGPASLALLHCLMQLQNPRPDRAQKGKVHFRLAALHVDESAAAAALQGGAAAAGAAGPDLLQQQRQRAQEQQAQRLEALRSGLLALGFSGELHVLQLQQVFEPGPLALKPGVFEAASPPVGLVEGCGARSARPATTATTASNGCGDGSACADSNSSCSARQASSKDGSGAIDCAMCAGNGAAAGAGGSVGTGGSTNDRAADIGAAGADAAAACGARSDGCGAPAAGAADAAAAAGASAAAAADGGATADGIAIAPATPAEQRLRQLLRSIDDATGREDLALHLRERLLLAAAEAAGTTRLARGDCGSAIAARVISDAAKGRGFSLAADIQACDARSSWGCRGGGGGGGGGAASWDGIAAGGVGGCGGAVSADLPAAEEGSGQGDAVGAARVVVLQPLKEVSRKELVALASYLGADECCSAGGGPGDAAALAALAAGAAGRRQWPSSVLGGGAGSGGGGSGAAGSINSLASGFVEVMQSSLPASIYTILRTASHLRAFPFNDPAAAAAGPALPQPPLRFCSICRAPLPQDPPPAPPPPPPHARCGGDGSAAASAARRLCYSCSRQVLGRLRPQEAAAENGAGSGRVGVGGRAGGGADERLRRLRELLPPDCLLSDSDDEAVL